MKCPILIIFTLFAMMNISFGQHNYYFKSWRAKGNLYTKGIMLLMDSTNSKTGKEFNIRLGTKLSRKLASLGIETNYSFNSFKPESGILVIEFKMIKPAYVFFDRAYNHNKFPLCNRFLINQISTIPKSKPVIKTELSISVDKEDDGLENATNELADLIFKSLRIIK